MRQAHYFKSVSCDVLKRKKVKIIILLTACFPCHKLDRKSLLIELSGGSSISPSKVKRTNSSCFESALDLIREIGMCSMSGAAKVKVKKYEEVRDYSY